jgi:hypothetical protein
VFGLGLHLDDGPVRANSGVGSHPGAAQARSMTPVISMVERLAVLEALNTHLQLDVTEIKHDVKELATLQSHLASDLAAKTTEIARDLASRTERIATNLAVTKGADDALLGARASTGVWVRAIVPWFLAGIGATVTFLHLVHIF